MTGHAPLFVRVNTRRIDAPGLCSRLAEEGVKAQLFPDFSDCVVLYLSLIHIFGSKAQDIEIARIVVNVKSEIEKIREQIQNIE